MAKQDLMFMCNGKKIVLSLLNLLKILSLFYMRLFLRLGVVRCQLGVKFMSFHKKIAE